MMERKAYIEGLEMTVATWRQRAERAEAALAERDRMLHAVFTESMGLKPGALSEKGWLAYLRSRAEEGSEDE